MAFTIPNQADAGTSSQSEIDAQDIAILVAAYNGSGVVTGGAVTAQSSPDMTVAVAAGTVMIAGTHYGISAGNATIGTADSSNPRFDLISINTSGALVVTAGTAAANPVFPTLPSNTATMAAVHVPAGDTAIATAQITDKRVIARSPGVPDDTILWLGTTGDTAIMHSASIIGADVEVANLIEGTSVHLATTANSLIFSNITDNGDILFLVSDGGNSKGLLHLDGTNGRVVIHAGDMLLSGTQKLYFNDAGGEYMSGDGSTLTITGAVAATGLVSTGALDAGSITSNFGTIDNGASTITTTGTITGGALSTGGAVTAGAASTISIDADSEFIALKLTNQSDAASTAGYVTLAFDLEDTGGTAVDAGKISVIKEASFTATASTQDSKMEFQLSENGTLGEKMTLSSAGALSIDGALSIGGSQVLSGSLLATAVKITGANWSSGGQDLGVADGGTNLSSYASGDIIYASGTTALSKLNKPGSPAGEVLTFASGASAPSWVAPSGGGGKNVGFILAMS